MSQNLEKFGVQAVWLDEQFQRGVKAYNDALKKADTATGKATQSMGDDFAVFDEKSKRFRNFKTGKFVSEIQKGARTSKASFTEIFSAVQLAIGALRTFAQAAGAAFRAAQEGAAQLGQQRSFAIVSGGAEQAAKNLQAMREATRGTATDAELMAQAVNILALGLAKDETQLFQVTRNVTQLGRTFKAFGAERSLLSFQLLASDLERSRARLDDFGLTMADVKPRMDELVASGMDLQEATRVALLEAMDRQMEKLGLTAATTADSFGQATAAAGNMSNELKQSLAPAGAIVADSFARAITNADDLTEVFDRIARGAIKVAATLDAVFTTAQEFNITRLEEFGRILVTEIQGETNVAARFQEVYNNALERGTRAMDEASSVAAKLSTTTEEVATSTDQAADSLQKFSDAIAQSRTQALQAFLQRAIATERQLEDAAIARARKIEDIERQAAARRAQIQEQYATTVANLHAQAAEQRRTNAIQLARQLEQIERNYQERKRAIEQQFAVSFSRAVRSRDALALVEAIRTRKTDLDEAKRARDQERAEATTNAAQQEAEQAQSLERQLEAARVARAQQLADQAEAEAAQLEAMRRAEERQAEDRARAAARWLEDQTRAFEDRRQRALGEYQQDESIYLAHLQAMLRMTNTYIPQIFRTGGGSQRPSGSGAQRMAEGGALVADRATNVTFGEAGPELAIFQPLSQIANVNPVSPQVAGQMRHQVSGEIQASMAGFQGRLTAAVNDAVIRAMGEVLR